MLADLREQLQAGLSGAYAIERELGRGGMATVYLAQDLKHKRPVALKVLHPELAASLGPERFQREIEFAARLQHPHILTVLDSGNANGQLWFTMPYVEGESLRARLARERQLPLDTALGIAREAARALDYAHQHGVIHRDIKPENILLTKDGSTLVADFGIARGLTGEAPLTQTGLAVGTPAYMSPEQASADKAIDARTDVYSLGAVLYEMLAGEPPYTGPTAQIVIARRLTEPAPSVRRVRPSVPEAIDQAIQRALAPVPADRFATMAEFARAIQAGTTAIATIPTPASATPSATTVAASASQTGGTGGKRRVPVAALTLGLGFALGLGVLFAWRRTHTLPPENAGPKVVAVLPFENIGDTVDAYLADGVTDEVRTKLARIAGLQVIARGSSTQYRHTAKPQQQIARELGADYLLTGTVRWETGGSGPKRVRVSPELVNVGPGHAPSTRWGEQFDATLTDVFQVQAEIAGKVASALDVGLGDSTRHELAAKPTENLAAYDAFLKGEAASQGMSVSDPASLRRAIGFYGQAVALDSAFVPAWAQLARARAALYYNGAPTPAEAEQARQAVDRAQALGPKRPEPYLAAGQYYNMVTTEHPRALASLETGLRLAPNNVDLLVLIALIEESLGRWDAALVHLRRAATLDPRSANTWRRIGSALVSLRRYPEAGPAHQRALALAPTNLAIIEQGIILALAQGDFAGAQSALRAGLATVEPAALLEFVANYQDLYWLLDDAQQLQLLALPLSAFDNDRVTWTIIQAQVYHFRGDRANTRVYADSARLANLEALRATPNDAQRQVFLGLSLAYLGRKADAIREGERATALLPISRDAFLGPYIQQQLVRIYLLVGEPEKALDRLEPLLKMPYLLSPAWLRVDPTFAPLKGNPRFERLITGS
jgi:TolB-like protein/tRNA A-37 threonylcarbamoyl transferase component Bud32